MKRLFSVIAVLAGLAGCTSSGCGQGLFGGVIDGLINPGIAGVIGAVNGVDQVIKCGNAAGAKPVNSKKSDNTSN